VEHVSAHVIIRDLYNVILLCLVLAIGCSSEKLENVLGASFVGILTGFTLISLGAGSFCVTLPAD
jgi:hypothetical protein